MHCQPLVLIGPYLSGKTTIRHLLAAALQRPQLGLVPWQDEAVVIDLFQAGGWDPAEEARAVASGVDLDAYLRPFQVYAIEQAIAKYPDHIIGIAADWPVQADPALFQRVQRALAGCQHVILLLPSPDLGTSYRVLRERKPAASLSRGSMGDRTVVCYNCRRGEEAAIDQEPIRCKPPLPKSRRSLNDSPKRPAASPR